MDSSSPITINEDRDYRDIQKKLNHKSLISEAYGLTNRERTKLRRLFNDTEKRENGKRNIPKFVKAVLSSDGRDGQEEEEVVEEQNQIGLGRILSEVSIFFLFFAFTDG